MEETPIQLSHKTARGFVLPLGPFNLVNAVTDTGMVGCGAFDVAALDKFQYPAARITGVASVEDLLEGTVVEANNTAQERGIQTGMTGKEALEKL